MGTPSGSVQPTVPRGSTVIQLASRTQVSLEGRVRLASLMTVLPRLGTLAQREAARAQHAAEQGGRRPWRRRPPAPSQAQLPNRGSTRNTVTAHDSSRAGASCARVTTTATSLSPVVGVPSTSVSVVDGTTLYPAARCMAVQLDVTDPETGAPHTLSPYLEAAAHVYVAPADVSDAALRDLTTHAHAYTSLDADSLSWLSRSLCEDFSQMGTYPMEPLPSTFSAPVHALIALPADGAWRVCW